MRRRAIISTPLITVGCASRWGSGHDRLSPIEFQQLLQRLADAWNRGDARTAADCFSIDAIYVEPPQKQVYRGRDQLFRFFGGGAGRPGDMSMRWHRVVFDQSRQTGMAEFTFRYGDQVHGVVVVDVRDGLIGQWREYWYASELPFESFVAPSSPQ